MRTGYVLVAVLCLMSSAPCGCRSNGTLETQPPRAADLQAAAGATHAAYVRAVNAGTEERSEEIPAAYWAEGIKALHPVKVYTHRVNIVVVQRINGQTEEGKYIYIMISSYLPQSGDDGFVFSPNPRSGDTYNLGTGVFDFKRTRGQ